MWKVVGASVVGTSHEAAGKGCEDASGWRSEPDLTCLAVADGAGSRPLSRYGAELAVKSALLLADRVDVGDPFAWVRLMIEDVRDRITRLATAEGRDSGDYATTLAVAVLTAQGIYVAQVGDTIAVAGHQGRYETVAPALRGEYVNETTFVTDDGALDQARLTVNPATEVDAVFLSTDGLRMKILDDLTAVTPFAPFFEDVVAYLRSPEAVEDAIRQFLVGLDDQTGDDKSLVAAVWTAADLGLEEGGQPGPQTDAATLSPPAEFGRPTSWQP